MNALSLLLLCVPGRAFHRAATKRLAASGLLETAAQVWRRTLDHRSALKSKRPRHSPGVTFVLRYMEWDCALYLALQEQGMSREQAGLLIEEINWDIFGPPVALSFKASRLRSAKHRTRIRWVLDALFLLLFTAPFRRQLLPSPDVAAFDVVACPLADYFRRQGVPELTRHAACSLDHRMAGVWGVRLDRSQTIADGAPLCDFRFRTIPPGPTNR